jgi:hypothetical protein
VPLKTSPYITVGLLALCIVGRAQAQLTYLDSLAQHTATVTGYNGTLIGALAIPSSHTVGLNTYQVVGIGANAFVGQTGLTEVTIANTVINMGAGAFQGCTGLGDATLSTSLTGIGASAFAGCDHLTAIAIPNSVTSVGSNAFSGCTRLASLTIGNRVTGIGASAFYQCAIQGSVTIPSTVTNIGDNAFGQNSALTSAAFIGNAPFLGASVFALASAAFKIYYFDSATGFTSPSWTDTSGDTYPAVDMGTFSPIKPWLVSYGLAYDTDPASDLNNDGVSLLVAYAFNLDPFLNLASALPKPVATPNQLSLTFYGRSQGVTYTVETTTDLVSWTRNGISLAGPDANNFYTATIQKTAPAGFLHIKIVY